MPTYAWDAAFEADPADLDQAKYGAGEARELKLAISERGELEHNFKAGTQPYHRAGKCSVLFIGTTAEIAALSGMPKGSIAWDTTIKAFKKYIASWGVTDLDHGQLSGLSDDDHTQYLNLTKEAQTLEENLSVTDEKTIDGVDISVHAAGTAKAQHDAGIGTHTHLSAGAEGGVLTLAALPIYDSGWFAVGANTTYTKAHGLVTVPRIVQILLAQNNDGSGWCTGPYAVATDNDQFVLVELTATNIVLRSRTYLCNIHDKNGAGVRPASCYCKVIAVK